MEQLLRCRDVGGRALREGFSKTASLCVVVMWFLVYKAIYEQELISKSENINDLIRSYSRLKNEYLILEPCLIIAAQ